MLMSLVCFPSAECSAIKRSSVPDRSMFICNVFFPSLFTPGCETNNNFTSWKLTGPLDVLSGIALTVEDGDFDAPTDVKKI